MSIDIGAAERFIHANARVLERHRLAVLLRGASNEAVLQALRAYRNPDGGFGHALEPDVRAPQSEPASTLHALEILVEAGAREDPMVAGAAAWIGTIARADGSIPFVLPSAARHPHAPWMVDSDSGSFLTFSLVARLCESGSTDSWQARGTEWCWTRLEHPEDLAGYWVKFALEFLDRVPEQKRALAAIGRLRSLLAEDGSLPVPGGLEGERLTPLELSPRHGLRSRALFTDRQIEADLNLLENGQRADGGWTINFLEWSPGQGIEWRGMMTLQALRTLAAHTRIRLPTSD